ncbi:GtrA family protein [Pontixanthobacter sp. CEM42]|uniref:GtrA family protein n=1 Tax=Pontixanthobacter sp. CEM42 TaxID=2792077 RepID=UPI001ADF2966|nr:GtrA family protein [Pontixanthobacter sp. CEM42]
MEPPFLAGHTPKPPLLNRLFKPRVGWMLARNTVVSTGAFLVGLAVLWLLVEQFAMNEIAATGISFIIPNTLHYILGRTWIFKGTDRAVTMGWVLFLINGLIGLLITMGAMALLREYTPINLYVARILVSVIAGLTMFVLNAVWNFRRV